MAVHNINHMTAVKTYALVAALVIITILGILLHTERSKQPVTIQVVPKYMANSLTLGEQNSTVAGQLNRTVSAVLDGTIINRKITEVIDNKMLNKTVSDNLDNTHLDICKQSTPGAIRCWDKRYPFVFMHVGKNGGQSFDHVIPPIVRQLGGRYRGFAHFDWSGVAKENRNYIAILLRHPVERFISHFYFSKTCEWTVGSPIRQTSLHDYLEDYQLMLDTYQIWQDGAAGAVWLTGTHIDAYVGTKPEQVLPREIENLNHTHICLLAAQRFAETWWFGFIEDQERSFELLRYQMGYTKPIRFPHNHKTGIKKVVSERDRQILESLIPMDMWVYKYAQLMFEGRWTQYKTGVYVQPEKPPIPEPACKATRFAIRCTKGPLGQLYFQGKAPPGHRYLI